MHDNINISFQHTDCPEENILKAYHNNSLSKPDIRKVELHLADCEMCSDYLEGLSLLTGTQELESEAKEIIFEINKDRSKKNRFWLYASAASVFLAISIFTIIWFMPVKNNFVAQEVHEIIKNSENSPPPPPPPTDSIETSINGLYKNSAEAESGENLGEKQLQQQVIKTVDASGKAVYIQNEDLAEKDIPKEDGYFKNLESPGNVDNSKLAEVKTEVTFSTKIDENQNKVTTSGDYQNIAGGVAASSTLVSQEEEKIESGKKADKKNRENAKQKEIRSVADEIAASEQSPVTISKNEAQAKFTSIDDIENTESNQDLDKAKVFYRQQMADSAVVYALRATTSCDSCKWSALLLLSKSYLTSGQTEKAVTTLKEVKSKAPAKFAKEARLELEKLGY